MFYECHRLTLLKIITLQGRYSLIWIKSDQGQIKFEKNISSESVDQIALHEAWVT